MLSKQPPGGSELLITAFWVRDYHRGNHTEGKGPFATNLSREVFFVLLIIYQRQAERHTYLKFSNIPQM